MSQNDKEDQHTRQVIARLIKNDEVDEGLPSENSNGTFLIDYKCDVCGGKLVVGGSHNKVRVWCSVCNRQMTQAALIKHGFNTFGSGI